MAISKDWIDRQIYALSLERERAKVRISEARNAFEKAQKEVDEAQESYNIAFELLDRLDDCIAGLKDAEKNYLAESANANEGDGK
jgi:hypothetical protein